jgi:hypothetical protein
MLSISFLYVFNWSGIHIPAFIYTDPGSGALIWQLLVASFFGILFYLRSFIRRITEKLSSRRSKERSNPQAGIERNGSTTPNRNRFK